jgi:DNA-binding LytR/AlgR family response regulator
VRLFPSDIYYVESFAHSTSIHTQGGKVEARASIGDLEETLGEDFCRTHRSYLVGLRFIRQITKADVVMDNGSALPLSRRRYDEVNRAFIRFFRRED